MKFNRHFIRAGFSILFPLSLGFSNYALAEDDSKKDNSMPADSAYLSDQTWGTVLFEFYQQNYRQGLVQQAIAKQQGLGEHAPQALIAEGGMSLVFGLSNQAERIFNQLSQSQDPKIQAQAWYWLTKSYFDSGQWSAAEQALNKTKNWQEFYINSEKEQLAYMGGQFLLIQNNQESTSETLDNTINQLPKDSVYRPYLHYNFGLQLLNSGQTEQAIVAFNQAKAAVPSVSENSKSSWKNSWWAGWLHNWFDHLWNSPSESITQLEAQGLHDRIHLASGYAYLSNEDHQQALNEFANIHHQHQDAANALLGYAQALANQGNVPLALAIWQKISQDHPSTLAALQSLLAMAWQLEQAGDEQQAWQTLVLLQEQLNHAQQAVEQGLSQIKKDSFLDNFSQLDSEKNQSDFVQTWPLSQMDILQTLLAGQSKEQLNNWMDLTQEQHLLSIKKQDVAGFKQLLDERQQATLKRSEEVANQDFVQQTQHLESKLNLLAENIEYAESQQDASVFANQEQLAQLKRLAKAKQRLNLILQHKQISPKYAQRLARVEGALIWHFSENYHPLLWQHKQDLAAAQKLLEQAKNSNQSLLDFIAAPPTFTDEYQKVSELSNRLESAFNKILLLKQTISQSITNKAEQALTKRVDYLLEVNQAIKLAKLRLQDKDPAQIDLTTATIGGDNQ